MPWRRRQKTSVGISTLAFLRLNCSLDNSIWQTQQIRFAIYCVHFVQLTKERKSEITQMSCEEKMLMLRSAVKEGQKLNASKSELDASKKARKKRKIPILHKRCLHDISYFSFYIQSSINTLGFYFSLLCDLTTPLHALVYV